MIITKVSIQQRDPNRANIFIDGKYEFSLNLDQVLDFKVKPGLEISDTQKSVLQKASEDGKLYAKVVDWLMIRPRSESELRRYLFTKKVDSLATDKIVTRVQARKYQNDFSFARWWAEGRLRKNKSNIAIKMELLQKGIDKTIIEEVLGESDTQKDRLRAIIIQKQNLPKYQLDKIKFKKYLYSKGFSYSDIDEVLADCADED